MVMLFALGVAACLLAEVGIVCAMVVLAACGVWRRLGRLRKAAREKKATPPQVPERPRGGYYIPPKGGHKVRVGTEPEAIVPHAEMVGGLKAMGATAPPPATIHIDASDLSEALRQKVTAAVDKAWDDAAREVLKGACSCGSQIPGDGWAHSWRGCSPGWPGWPGPVES